MAGFEGETFDGEGRYTYAYATHLREQEAAARAKRERAEAEARGELDAERAKQIASDMDDWHGRPAYRDPVAEIITRVIEEAA